MKLIMIMIKSTTLLTLVTLATMALSPDLLAKDTKLAEKALDAATEAVKALRNSVGLAKPTTDGSPQQCDLPKYEDNERQKRLNDKNLKQKDDQCGNCAKEIASMLSPLVDEDFTKIDRKLMRKFNAQKCIEASDPANSEALYDIANDETRENKSKAATLSAYGLSHAPLNCKCLTDKDNKIKIFRNQNKKSKFIEELKDKTLRSYGNSFMNELYDLTALAQSSMSDQDLKNFPTNMEQQIKEFLDSNVRKSKDSCPNRGVRGDFDKRAKNLFGIEKNPSDVIINNISSKLASATANNSNVANQQCMGIKDISEIASSSAALGYHLPTLRSFFKVKEGTLISQGPDKGMISLVLTAPEHQLSSEEKKFRRYLRFNPKLKLMLAKSIDNDPSNDSAISDFESQVMQEKFGFDPFTNDNKQLKALEGLTINISDEELNKDIQGKMDSLLNDSLLPLLCNKDKDVISFNDSHILREAIGKDCSSLEMEKYLKDGISPCLASNLLFCEQTAEINKALDEHGVECKAEITSEKKTRYLWRPLKKIRMDSTINKTELFARTAAANKNLMVRNHTKSLLDPQQDEIAKIENNLCPKFAACYDIQGKSTSDTEACRFKILADSVVLKKRNEFEDYIFSYLRAKEIIRPNDTVLSKRKIKGVLRKHNSKDNKPLLTTSSSYFANAGTKKRRPPAATATAVTDETKNRTALDDFKDEEFDMIDATDIEKIYSASELEDGEKLEKIEQEIAAEKLAAEKQLKEKYEKVTGEKAADMSNEDLYKKLMAENLSKKENKDLAKPYETINQQNSLISSLQKRIGDIENKTTPLFNRPTTPSTNNNTTNISGGPTGSQAQSTAGDFNKQSGDVEKTSKNSQIGGKQGSRSIASNTATEYSFSDMRNVADVKKALEAEGIIDSMVIVLSAERYRANKEDLSKISELQELKAGEKGAIAVFDEDDLVHKTITFEIGEKGEVMIVSEQAIEVKKEEDKKTEVEARPEEKKERTFTFEKLIELMKGSE